MACFVKKISVFLTFFILLFVFVEPCFAATEQVSLRLQWKHQFEFAGFYAAKELGYYREAGLDVELVEYENGVDVVDEVLSANVDFGIWGSGLIEHGMQGKPIVFLANYFKRSPLALATQPEIESPADLIGKTVMISEMDLNNAHYTQMFRTLKIDPQTIKQVQPTFNVNDFSAKKVAAVSIFLTNEPFLLQ